VGIATGTAEWGLQDHTHALVYSGRPVAAAAKLAAAAASGQVLCDEATRNEAAAEQLWALSLEDEMEETGIEEEEQETVVEGTQGGAGQRAVDGAAALPARRQQLLTFTRADSAGPGLSAPRRKGLARAYVCG
jgi:class 3 adenylate cyclase